MKQFLPCILLLAACEQQAAAPTFATGTFAGEGRDRLCIAGEPGNYRAGVIAYGEGDINCSASGTLETSDGKVALVPRGEGQCRIALLITATDVRIDQVPPQCSYYCGPGARLENRLFTRRDDLGRATDLAGSPLC